MFQSDSRTHQVIENVTKAVCSQVCSFPDAFYEEIVRQMDDDVLDCKAIFDRGMEQRDATGKIPLHKNQAKVSGSLRWAYELKDRMNANMDAFKRIEHP